MTAPRRVVPRTTHLVTRRCSERRFFLRPSRATNQTFLYLLAIAAQRYAIEVHTFCVLSNHFHMVVTDTDARLPAFHQYLDGLVARAVNAQLGRAEAFWAPNSYSAVQLVSPEDVVEKAAYTLANPVAAGLVPAGRLWPGLWSDPDSIGGRVLEVERPKGFFDEDGEMPAVVTLRLAPPPGFTADGFRAKVSARLGELEERARSERGGQFLGVARVKAQNPNTRPAQAPMIGALNPRVAARDKWKRIEALGRLVEFLERYRAARAERRAGNTGVVFPLGTYWMRVAHGVPCEAFG